MSLLMEYNYDQCADNADERYYRSIQDDIKEGIDHVFQLKMEIAKLHPVARETLVRMLTNGY